MVKLIFIERKRMLQFSSVAQSCLTLCYPMNRSTPGLLVHHQLPESTQTHVHCVGDVIQPISSSVVPFSSCPQSFPASGPFPMSQLFASVGQSIGDSASTSVLPMNTQDWSALGWTDWISLQSKWIKILERVYFLVKKLKINIISMLIKKIKIQWLSFNVSG